MCIEGLVWWRISHYQLPPMTLSLLPFFSLPLPPFPSHSPSSSHFPSPSHCYISCPSISSHNPLPPSLLLPLPLYLPLSFFNSTFQVTYLLLPSLFDPFQYQLSLSHHPLSPSLSPSTPPSYLPLSCCYISCPSILFSENTYPSPTYKQLHALLTP